MRGTRGGGGGGEKKTESGILIKWDMTEERQTFIYKFSTIFFIGIRLINKLELQINLLPKSSGMFFFGQYFLERC